MALPQDLQDLLPCGLRRREVLVLDPQLGQPVQRADDLIVAGGQGLALDGQRGLGRGDRLGELPGGAELPALLLEAVPLLEGSLRRLRSRLAESDEGHRAEEARCQQHDDPEDDAAYAKTPDHDAAPGSSRSWAGAADARPGSLLPIDTS
jgi:hypothetical protein